MTSTQDPALVPTASSNSSDFPEVVLSLAEAAWASGLPRDELQKLVRAGDLRVRRVVRSGRVVAVVSMKELERVHSVHSKTKSDEAETSAGLRERLARIEGQLEASERVERSLQRYTDRLEVGSSARIAKLELSLETSRKREMTMARAIGQLEGRVAQLGGAPTELSDGVSDDLAHVE